MRLEGSGGIAGRRQPIGSRSLASALALALLIGTLGCQKPDPVADLKQRAEAYWSLKQAKKWDEVYDKYVDPESKKNLTKDAFLKRRWLAFDILSYEITEAKDEGDKGTVAATNEVNFPLKTPQGELTFIKKQVVTKDPWVRRDGVWYVVLTE
jgi:hypothetical protein